MGIWEFVNSGTDAVKRNVPGLNTVQDASKTTYSYGAAAATKIDKVIRIDGLQTISSRMPDEQSRAQIGLFASRFAQNATGYAVKEGFKMFPGGKAIAEIYDKTIHDVRTENQSSFHKNVSKKEVIGGNVESGRHTSKRDMVEVMEKQVKEEGLQIISETQPYCISNWNEKTFANEKQLVAYPNGIQKPEDVLRVFMMKEFMGARILDDLLIPQSGRGKGTTTNSNFVA